MVDAAQPPTADTCPACAAATVTLRGAAPWCPACEWQLDRYEPERRSPVFGWRWVDRLDFRLAYRLTSRLFAALAGRRLDRPGPSVGRFTVIAVSAALLAGVVALGVAGIWLICRDFPSLSVIPGALFLGIAVVLRPRFGRLDGSATPLTRSAAPRLFRLVDDVALAVGARTPHVIAVDETFNAYAVAVGVRRRRVLCLGLPLWAALGPQQRVALLGHELGHFVNGDVRRGLLAQPAFTTLATAADLTRPVDDQSADVVSWFAAKAAQLFQLMISRTLLGLHFVLLSIALRDAQRSEYLADDMAAAVAGSAAATEMLDTLLAIEAVDTVVRRSARVGGGPAQWRAAAAEALANLAPRLPAMRQLSLRDDVSLFMTHPPAGLRARLLDARPQRPPTVVLTAADAQLIDDELDRHYARSRRDIGWSA